MKNILTFGILPKSLSLISRYFLPFIIISITACGGSSGNNDNDTPVDLVPLKSAVLTIDVITRSALPIPEGSITIADKTTIITKGRAEFTELAAGEVRGIVRVPGFVPKNVFAYVVEGENTSALVTLLPIGASITFAADQPADLQHDGNAVRLTANSFVDDQGNPISGTITAHLTSFDPSEDMRAAPGPFRGMTADGTEDLIESFAMASYSFEADGKTVQLAAGKTADIEIELTDIYGENNGATLNEIIPAWYYDLEQGQWIEEGIGTVFDIGNRLVWTATVEHFSYWNADRKIAENECVIVEVPFSFISGLDTITEGLPVISEGVDYTGGDESFIDDRGLACVDYKRGGSANIAVRIGNAGSAGYIYTQNIVGSGAPNECTEDGSQSVGCTTILVHVPPLSCVRGKVSQGTLPIKGAQVVLGFGLNLNVASTDANGDFCAIVPPGIHVYADVGIIDGSGSALFANADVLVGDTTAGCGAPELCADVGVMELSVPPQYCMEGQVTQDTPFDSGVPVSAGTPLLAFNKDGFGGLNCQTSPSSWGVRAAEGTIGENGDYCLNLPLAENSRELVFVANSCNRDSCNTDNPEAICARTDEFTLLPGAETGHAGGICGSAISCIGNDMHIAY